MRNGNKRPYPFNPHPNDSRMKINNNSMNKPNSDGEKKCHICKRENHSAVDCRAKTYADGSPIPQNLLSEKAKQVIQRFPSKRFNDVVTNNSTSKHPSASTNDKVNSLFPPKVVKNINVINEMNPEETWAYSDNPQENQGVMDETYDSQSEQYYEGEGLFNENAYGVNMIVPVSALRKDIPQSDGFLYCPVIINDTIKLRILVDCGAKVSIVDKDLLLEKFPNAQVIAGELIKLQAFSGELKDSEYTVELKILCANISVPITHRFQVTQSGFPIICGLDLMKPLKIGVTNIPLDFPKEIVIKPVNITNLDENISEKYPGIKKALELNQLTAQIPCSHPEALISLQADESNLRPVPQYPIEHVYKKFVNEQISEWLRDGVIRRATESQVFCSPILTVSRVHSDLLLATQMDMLLKNV